MLDERVQIDPQERVYLFDHGTALGSNLPRARYEVGVQVSFDNVSDLHAATIGFLPDSAQVSGGIYNERSTISGVEQILARHGNRKTLAHDHAAIRKGLIIHSRLMPEAKHKDFYEADSIHRLSAHAQRLVLTSAFIAGATSIAMAAALFIPSAAAALPASIAIMRRSYEPSHTGWRKKVAGHSRVL